jgi:hypothetical protein
MPLPANPEELAEGLKRQALLGELQKAERPAAPPKVEFQPLPVPGAAQPPFGYGR